MAESLQDELSEGELSSSRGRAPTAYDRVPYPAGAYAQSHPDRLEALATLFGLEPPDSRECRVLEIGCADGSNLIPMACARPRSRFLGIDQSKRQIASGRETIADLGLSNIVLEAVDLRDFGGDEGGFDYVIAHGIYSWIPPDAQSRLLAICREMLAERGVAYISYNTNPGWRMRGMLRDMMLYHARKFDDPQTQVEQARALVQWLARSVDSETTPYGLLLKSELEQMRHWQDAYFRHDSLEEINEPVYFHQFVERAEAHGLQYLADAEFSSMIASNFGAPIDEALNRLARDLVEMEQYLDFLRNRMFRQTLLCRRGHRLNRALGPGSLLGLRVASGLKPLDSDAMAGATAERRYAWGNRPTLTTSDPLTQAALGILAEYWPGSIPLAELAAAASAHPEVGRQREDPGEGWMEREGRALASTLLTCYCRGLCELHVREPAFTVQVGERPRACPLVRWQARRGGGVTNRRHERVELEGVDRVLATLLTGEFDLPGLATALIGRLEEGQCVLDAYTRARQEGRNARDAVAAEVPGRLARLARCALLEG